MKKLRKILAILGALVLLIIAAVGVIYWRAWAGGGAATVVGQQTTPETKHIGDPIRTQIEVSLPWGRRPIGDVRVDPPEGLQQITGAPPKLQRIGVGQWQWTTELMLQAYDFGPFEEITASIYVTPDRDGGNESVTVTLPKITITPKGAEPAELMVAGELNASFLDRMRQESSLWWWVGGGCFALALLALWLFSRRGRPAAVPDPPKPWIVAETALHRLNDRLPLDADTVFVELTDIIRRYVEAVYELRATEMTTPEFLRDLNRNEQLSTEHRLLLSDFLTAADMVKFARVDATQSQIEDMLEKAKRFIVETSEPIIRGQTLPEVTALPASSKEAKPEVVS